jgi:hypothetical protein
LERDVVTRREASQAASPTTEGEGINSPGLHKVTKLEDYGYGYDDEEGVVEQQQQQVQALASSNSLKLSLPMEGRSLTLRDGEGSPTDVLGKLLGIGFDSLGARIESILAAGEIGRNRRY